MLERFVEKKFGKESIIIIEIANQVIETYRAQGYILTLRQLYYQFVSRDIFANTERNYKRLGSIIDDARKAGLIDWDAIEDRTRRLRSLSTWESPREIIASCAQQFRVNPWDEQPDWCEVWVEKEALAGVVERAANEMRVPFFCCRGYPSSSAMYEAAQRLLEHEARRGVHVIYLGDHDPSGIDMARNVRDGLNVFSHGDIAGLEVHRIALNMDQVDEYSPPPNPAKQTDSRCASYVREFGDESWELDALEPAVLHDLIVNKIKECVDEDAWDESISREDDFREEIGLVSINWSKAVQGLKE